MFNLYYNSRMSYDIKTWLAVDLCMTYLLMLVTMTLTLMQGHSGLEMANIQC